MKLKTKIRAGKIRPNHNVTVHGTAASSQPKGRRRARQKRRRDGLWRSRGVEKS
jgi:hypothetical protein